MTDPSQIAREIIDRQLFDERARAVARALLEAEDRIAKLREENERLTVRLRDFDAINDQRHAAFRRADKAEAEVERLESFVSGTKGKRLTYKGLIQ